MPIVLLLPLLMTARTAAAETWVQVDKRAADSETLYIDRDSISASGSRVQFSTKIHPGPNAIRSVLSLGQWQLSELLEEYVVDCDQQGYALVKQQFKAPSGFHQTYVDAPVNGTPLTPWPAGAMIGKAATFACSFARMSRQPLKSPELGSPALPDNGEDPTFRDNLLKNSTWSSLVNGLRLGDGRLADLFIDRDSIHVNPGAKTVVASGRVDLQAPEPNEQSASEVYEFDVNCSNQTFRITKRLSYDVQKQITSRVLVASPFRDVQTHPAEPFAKYVCVSYADVAQRSGERRETPQAQASTPSVADKKETTQAVAPMRQVSFGTAWLSDRGYFLTASHVVQDGAQVFLRSVDGRVEEAIVVINDQRNDLAVLRANIPSGSSGLSLARSGTPLGARVYTMGFPHPNVLGVTPKFTAGEVNAVAGLGDDPRILQVSNPVQSGNSGGPLLNTFGEVVGQISAKLSATEIFRTTGDLPQNVNYALKGSYIGAILEDFPAGSSAPRPLKPKTAEEIATAVRKAIFLVIAQ